MQIDCFPVTTPQTTLKEALAEMKRVHRSGIVVNAGHDFSFVLAGQVVVAMVEKTTRTLKPLADKNPIAFIEPRTVDLPHFDFRHAAPHVALEQYLNACNRKFALVAVTSSRAIVASRHEDDMPEQAQPRDCYCREDYKDVSLGHTGGNCPHDRRHKGTVVCL